MSNLIIRNCQPYNLAAEGQPVDIAVRNGRISQIGHGLTDPAQPETFDAGGRTMIPGLIDVHVHGAGGGDTSDGTAEALRTMSSTLAQRGITSFLATGMTRREEGNQHLENAGEYTGKDLGGANLLGLHIEGPFVSREKRGGIQLGGIETPSVEVLDELLETTKGALKMMTIAPEVDGALNVIRELVNRGIIASFGHSDADYEETKAGLIAGISHVTHFFNTMRPLHHRDPGPVPAIFEQPGVTVQVICDGIHLHRDMVRYIYKQFGGERCICVTDGMRTMGLPDGKYFYYGKEYESRGGIARYLDGTLIGTTYNLHQMLLNFLEFTGCSLDVAVNTATANPAKVLGIDDRKGAITVGKDADLVVLDQDRSVWATIIGGRIIYRKVEGEVVA
ncbi:MAG: N-acetylglucosamine-6-phosphate deacetylase [Fidelibacterota bacterium]|nr:MAG: N-acetylglucosamine-6-phosphate deacetylase [Candidatus Neomarinimicrobiota bacterium]